MVFSGIENQGFSTIRTGPQHNHIFHCVCGNEWLGCVGGPGWAVPRAGYTVCKNECQYPHPLCVLDSTNLSSLWRFLWNKSVVWSKRAKHSAEQRSGLCRYKSNRWAEAGQELGNIHRQQTARTVFHCFNIRLTTHTTSFLKAGRCVWSGFAVELSAFCLRIVFT